MVTIVGLGATKGDLTLGALEALRRADKVWVRTRLHALADVLDEQGIACASLDRLYEESEDFDRLCERVAETVIGEGQGDVVYAVPGGAALTDETVRAVSALCAARGVACEILPGVGWEARAAAMAGGLSGATVVAAADYAALRPDPRRALVVVEIASREVAGELKLRLTEAYPAEHTVLFCGARMELAQIDRQAHYAHDATLVVPQLALNELERFDFYHLVEVMALLRDPQDGCPWDREQTHDSLKPYLIEEAYEAVDAVDTRDPMALADELGDVILQAAFHAQIGSEHGEFSIDDVTTAICQKMISRHTHIFGTDDRAATAEEVLATWEANKRREKGQQSAGEALLGVCRALPAAMRAQKILRKAEAARGDKADLRASAEALRRATNAVAGGDTARAGDMLLAAVNLARVAGEPAEQVLDQATRCYVQTFIQAERVSNS